MQIRLHSRMAGCITISWFVLILWCCLSARACDSNPCWNGATCTGTNANYWCTCVPGFTGRNCAINLDECTCNPCLNQGTCEDGVNEHTCSCVVGFTGTNCETNVDDCMSNPCQNKGTCKDGVNMYTCSCVAGYSGTHCETDLDECASSPCQHGGMCKDAVNMYTCVCEAGWTSRICELDIDECTSNTDDCHANATCTNIDGSFSCACNAGFSGDGRWCSLLAPINSVFNAREIRSQPVTPFRSDSNRVFNDYLVSYEDEYQTVIVTSVVVLGIGDDSSVSVSTGASEPSPPRSIAVTVVNSSAVKVTWLSPENLNGVLGGYRVKYYRNDKGGGSFDLLVVGNESLSRVVGGLQAYTNYSVSVQAFVVADGQNISGPFSFPFAVAETDPEVPDGPPTMVQAVSQSSTSITLTWDQPDLDNRNGRITGYRITYYPQDNSSQVTKVMDIADMSREVEMLVKYTFYCFKVAARSHFTPTDGRDVYGPDSDTVCEQTQQDVPGESVLEKPVVRSSGSGEAEVDLTWNRPQPNGIITAYEIFRNGTTTYNDAGQIRVDSDVVFQVFTSEFVIGPTVDPVTVTITGLIGSTFYIFKVRAYTSIGAGNFSNIQTILTPTTEPPPPPPPSAGISDVTLPDNVATPAITTTTLPAIFRKASELNGVITHYAIIVLDVHTDINSLDMNNSPVVSYYEFSLLTDTSQQKSPFFAFFGTPDELIPVTFTTAAAGDTEGFYFILGTTQRAGCSQQQTACNGELTPGTSYRFKIRAFTQVDDNNPSMGVFSDSKYSDPVTTNTDVHSAIDPVPIVVPTIAVLCCVAVGLALFFYKCSRRRSERIHLRDKAEGATEMTSIVVEPVYAHVTENTATYVTMSEVMIDEWPEYTNFHFDRNKLHLCDELGEGHFGKVWRAWAAGIDDRHERTEVAVKTVRKHAPKGMTDDFKQEVRILVNFDHENIIKVLGVCLLRAPYYMITELMNKGDLKAFVRKARPNMSDTIPIPGLSLHQLIDICMQVAAGLAYLARQKFVHRDIAARNCLVADKEDEKIIVKIADFGMAEDIYESDYCRSKGRRLPFRWMSPEAITDGTFTVKSDIWSFGVLMWEVFSFGFSPYFGCDNEFVRNRVVVGAVCLKRPPGCPEKVYELMEGCWKMDCGDRISAEKTEKKLKTLIDMLREFGLDSLGINILDRKQSTEFMKSGGYQLLLLDSEATRSINIAAAEIQTLNLEASVGEGAEHDGHYYLFMYNTDVEADVGHYQGLLTRPGNETYERPKREAYERPSNEAYERPKNEAYERLTKEGNEPPNNETYEQPSFGVAN